MLHECQFINIIQIHKHKLNRWAILVKKGGLYVQYIVVYAVALSFQNIHPSIEHKKPTVVQCLVLKGTEIQYYNFGQISKLYFAETDVQRIWPNGNTYRLILMVKYCTKKGLTKGKYWFCIAQISSIYVILAM